MKYLKITDFLFQDAKAPLIDVRSPAEYEKGHIPGAVNIPLFSNDERAAVGITYKKLGKEKAVKEGLTIVGPKMTEKLEEVEKLNPGKRVRLYCWRGGMRSSSVAWLFETGGYECQVLEGGYKSYRNLMSTLFEDREIILIGGETGSGKTEILKELANNGEQCVDLEGLANHRGSAFGAVGMPPQPVNEHFQNLVIDAFIHLDRRRRVFLEDESSYIGKVSLPEELWVRMKTAPLVHVQVPIPERIKRLVDDYGSQNTSELETSIRKIERKLGGQNMKAAIRFLKNGDMASVAKLMLYYYDKSYRFLLERKRENIIFKIDLPDPKPDRMANFILDQLEVMEVYGAK